MIKRFSFLIPKESKLFFWVVLAFMVAWDYRTFEFDSPEPIVKALVFVLAAAAFTLPAWVVFLGFDLRDFVKDKECRTEWWHDLQTETAAMECGRDLMIIASCCVLVPLFFGREGVPMAEWLATAAMWVFVAGVLCFVRGTWVHLRDTWRVYQLKKGGENV